MNAFHISLSGAVDVARHAELMDYCARFEASHEIDVVVDMVDVTYMDATGLLVLLTLRETAMRRGGEVALVNADQPCLRVLELSGGTEWFSVNGAAETA